MKTRYNRLKRLMARRNPEIVLTPLIDTALTLLIIFMVATPMLKKENALEIELPKGNIKETSDTLEEELVVSIDKTGKISFNDRIIERKQLIQELTKQTTAKNKKTVFVKADTAINYGFVLELVNDIKQVGGIGYVALATQEPKKSSLA